MNVPLPSSAGTGLRPTAKDCGPLIRALIQCANERRGSRSGEVMGAGDPRNHEACAGAYASDRLSSAVERFWEGLMRALMARTKIRLVWVVTLALWIAVGVAPALANVITDW